VKSYRPISNLTFMSKMVERLVCRQLVAFLQEHSLLPSHQSAYQQQHSTETAVLKIVSDLLFACDCGQVTLFALLDLSAAFDTVDHILLDHLQSAFGIRGSVIDWIQSLSRIARRLSASPVMCRPSLFSPAACLKAAFWNQSSFIYG